MTHKYMNVEMPDASTRGAGEMIVRNRAEYYTGEFDCGGHQVKFSDAPIPDF